VTDITLCLCGDVMTGRGVDQILPHPSRPGIPEAYVRDARDYVKLVEAQSGPIARPVDLSYPWGEALAEMRAADARIVNLETSVTSRGRAWPNKEVHYRMHPDNVGCLRAAGLDVCVLANNHVLDWGHDGLRDTLAALRAAGIATAGAGATLAEAETPATLTLAAARVLVFGLASTTSGVPPSWAATDARPGVWLLDDFSSVAADRVADRIRRHRREGDVVVASVHWGSNYGWDVPAVLTRFAHDLIERGVDVVHGHSSHHARPVEIHRGKLVLYGCGGFVDDYEGIDGGERDAYRIDLEPAYFATLDASRGTLERLRVLPLRLRRMRLERASAEDAAWLAHALDRASRPFGTRVEARGGALHASIADRPQTSR
jgi:poly-gamma-glutamate capsule biosynthesis protein CapA/YwtB (metallophosphatase superfamily)